MRNEILVSGLINHETTLAIDDFPLPYYPVTYAFNRVHTGIAGVGYNIAKALAHLGHQPHLLALVGSDESGSWAQRELAGLGVDCRGILPLLNATPASVILYDHQGRRQIHVDLKEIQELSYPQQLLEAQLPRFAIAALCNINYNRPLLAPTKAAGIPIATDVHVLRDLDDGYNRDFMAAADILFLSDEGLHGRDPQAFLLQLHERYGNSLLILGQGAQGALMYVAADRRFYQAAAISPRPIINSVGAGDALFSAFIHGISQHQDPYRALRQACLFAGWKIGAPRAAEGFLTASELAQLARQHGLS